MTTHSTPSPAPQIWRVPLWAWAPIALAVVAEAAVNALRAYGLGMQLEHFTVDVSALGFTATVSIAGVVLVLAAIAMSLSQARAAWVAFKPGALARQRTIAAPVALLLLVVSVTALSLTILEAQRGKTGDEGGQRTAYDLAKADHDKAEAEWKRLEGARTPAEVQAAMMAAPVDRKVFRVTKECNDVTKNTSFEACKPLLDLRQEMAGAIRKIELEQKLPGLKAALDALPRPTEPTWFELYAASGWAWAFGLAAVMIATFGAPLFAEPATVSKAEKVAPAVDTLGQSDFGALADHPALLGADAKWASEAPSKNRPDDRPAGGPKAPERPNRPKPSAPDNQPDGRTDDRKGRVLAFVQTEAAFGRSIPRQADIVERFGVPRSTVSDWMGEWESDGLIPARRTVGRCKAIVPERQNATA